MGVRDGTNFIQNTPRSHSNKRTHTKKNTNYILYERKKGKEISDIVKNYDYSYLSSLPIERKKKKHASTSYLFLKGKSEKDRQIGEKKREREIFYGSQVFPLRYSTI